MEKLRMMSRNVGGGKCAEDCCAVSAVRHRKAR